MTGTQRSHADGGRVCASSLRECGDKLEFGIGKGPRPITHCGAGSANRSAFFTEAFLARRGLKN
jgi:hypothetical protein